MALLGKNVAFIPIGLSCQVAHQLKENRLFLSRTLREPLEYRSAFLNWTLVSVTAVAPVMRRLVAGPPIGPGDLNVPKDYHRTLTFRDHNLWFWHEKLSHEINEDDLRELEAKYEQSRRNLLELASRPKRYFILASSQNNMASLYPFTEGRLQAVLTAKAVREIQRELDALFPRGRNRLIVVGKRRWIDMRGRVYTLPEEPTEWQGETADWQALFAHLFRLRLLFNRVEDLARPVLRHIRFARR